MPGHYVGGVSTSERVLVSHDRAAWLPEGGRADVVLAGVPAVVPSPICLVRLLVTLRNRILVVPRPDGRGLDLPTRRVEGAGWDEAVGALVRQAVDGDHPARLLGYVRNTVPGAPAGYPWSVPYAHFAVWHLPLPDDRSTPGTWLGAAEAEVELGRRHWWPLVAHVTSLEGWVPPSRA